MKLIVSAVLVFLFITACNNNESDNQPSNATVVPAKYDLQSDSSVSANEMKRYWLVLLKKGPNRNQDSLSAEKIQAAHMANINRLAEEGKLIMAGPMGVDEDLRGIFILNCRDSAEVENIVRTDSAVITGRLKMEFYPWWTMKGKYIFK